MRHLLLTVLPILMSCSNVHDLESGTVVIENSNSAQPAEPISFELGVAYSNTRAGSLNLFDATSFIFDVDGCKSGYSKTNQNTASDGAVIKLYKGDRDCVAKLKSFIWNAKTWTKQGGGSYSGPAAAVFVNNTDSEQVSVQAPDNIPSPLASADTTTFYFNLIEAGTAKQLVTTSNPVHLTNSANDAPYYKFKSSATGVVLDTIAAGTNIATFTFNLECKNAITTGGTVCPSQTNDDHTQTDMRVALIKDTVNGVLNWAQAQAAFDAATNITNIGAGDLAAAAGAFNGGFSVQVDGPEDLTTSKKMILLIEYNLALSADKTYTYFTIDFASGAALYFDRQ